MTCYIVRHKPTGAILPNKVASADSTSRWDPYKELRKTSRSVGPLVFGNRARAEAVLARWLARDPKRRAEELEVVEVELVTRTASKLFTLQLHQHQMDVEVPWFQDSFNMLSRVKELFAERVAHETATAAYAKDVIVIANRLGGLR